MKFLCLTEEASVTGNLKDIQFKICLEVDRSFSMSLKEFNVSSTGTILVNTENLGSYEFLSEKVTMFTHFETRTKYQG